MRRLVVFGLVLLSTSACTSFTRKQIVRVAAPEPIPAPIATRMSPALDCLGEAFVHDPPKLPLDVWVCPFAASSGLSPEAGWQYTMDALLRVSFPGGPINVRDCRPEFAPVPGGLEAGFAPGPSISGRAILENGVLAKYADFAGGVFTTGQNVLGVTADSEMSRMAVSLYLRDSDRSLFHAPIATAALFESSNERDVEATVAIVEGAGLSAGAGLLEVSSKEQILRHLIDASVFSMLVRYFEAGSVCIDAAEKWDQYRDEFLALDAEEQRRIKHTLRRRLGGSGKVPKTVPAYDAALTLDEYAWARASHFLDESTEHPTATVSAPSPAPAPAPRPKRVASSATPPAARRPAPAPPPSHSSGGLYLANGRLVSSSDGYAECFATDPVAGSRVQRLDIEGSTPEGRILKARAYPLERASGAGLSRIVCFRTPASVYEFLPVAVRSSDPVILLFDDIEAIYRRSEWKLGRLEFRTG